MTVTLEVSYHGDAYTVRLVDVDGDWCCEDIEPKPANQAEVDAIVWAAIQEHEYAEAERRDMDRFDARVQRYADAMEEW